MENRKEKINIESVIPSHTMEPTSDPDIFRVVDRDGNWTHYWKKSTSQFAPAVNHILKCGFNKGPRFMKWLLSVNEKQAAEILESAGDRGTRVHMVIEDLIRGNEILISAQYPSETQNGRFEKLTAEEWDCVIGFANWARDYKPTVYAQEQVIWNDVHLYAGTIDFLGTIALPKTGARIQVLIDWKTSANVYDEYKLQTAAYWAAYCATNRDKGEEFMIPEYTAVVRVGTAHKDKYEMKLYTAEETTNHFAKFLATMDLYEFTNPKKDSEPKIENIPAAFAIDVPKWKKPKQEVEAESVKKPRRRTSKKTKK